MSFSFFRNVLNGLKHEENEVEDKILDDANPIAFSAAQAAAYQAQNYALAANSMRDGMDQFLEMAERVKNKGPSFRVGHEFETIIAAKKNVETALVGGSAQTRVTHLEGQNTAAADLRTIIGNDVITEAQAKFSVQSPSKIAEMIADSKYQGMERYIPADKIDVVQKELQNKYDKYLQVNPERANEYLDASRNLKNHDIITREVIAADRSPNLYAAKNEVIYAAKEMAATGAYAAGAAFIVGGAISGVKNYIEVSKGNLDRKAALEQTIKEAGKSGVKGGATGVGGALLRNVAEKAGYAVKGNVAVTVANSLFDTGAVILEYSKGGISGREAAERMGQNGVSTMSSIYTGAAAGAVFGPVGALVGSVGGYLVASQVYQSSLNILKHAELAEEEAARIIALLEASTSQMRKQRLEFERMANEAIAVRSKEFSRIFTKIDQSFADGYFDDTVLALTDLATLFGKELKLLDFKEFDAKMKGNEPLIL